MERILIIGCCGAGKSTFARQLHSILPAELIHLDQHYWLPNWEEPDKLSWTAKVSELANRPSWIMDGNYGSSLPLRIPRADTIIYLDYPIRTCLWRVFKRVSKHHGKVRPDMPPGCKERFDLDFLHYVATFNITKRKSILRQLSAVADHKRIEVFKMDMEAMKFLNEIKKMDD